MQKINEIDNLGVVASPEELQTTLSETIRSGWRAKNAQSKQLVNVSSAQRMADIILR